MTVSLKKLPNGLTVLTEESRKVPVVAIQAWVQVGAADETPEVAGVAHLHEHMLFKGTARRGVGEIARSVEASGGEINAWTSFDQTVYHVVMAAAQSGLGLDILSDALRNSAFDPDELAREIEVVVEEIQRSDDSPERRISNATFSLAYQNHRYRYPVLGTRKSVRGMTRDDILGFYKKHYRPEQITVVAVGDFDTAQMQEQVEAYFGDWENPQGGGASERAVEPKQDGLRFELLKEDVKETRIALAWHIPEVGHGDIPAIDALAIVLGYGDSARLYKHLRQESELVNDIYSYAYTPKDPGLFMVGAGLKRENLQEVFNKTLVEVFRARQGIDESELEKAKVLMLSESAYLRETVQGQARKLGFYEVVARGYRFEEEYRRAVANLTTEDLVRVARKYLDLNLSAVVQMPNGSADFTSVEVQELCTEAFEEAEQSGSLRVSTSPFPDVLAVGPYGGETQVEELEVVRAELSNGCTLLVRQEATPILSLRGVALGGLRWEPASRCGLSNLFASTWGAQTENYSEEALAKRVPLLGGGISTFAGRSTLGLRADFIQEKADEGLDLVCETILRSTFEQKQVDREREGILERLRNRSDRPASVAFEAFVNKLYPNHPFGRSMLGTEESLAQLDIQSLEELRKQFATPDKMVISVVSALQPHRVIERLAAQLDGPAGPGIPGAPQRDKPIVEPLFAKITSEKKQSHVIIGGQGTSMDDRDKYVFEVLTTILSGQSGRLFLDLRDKQSLAYSVSASSVEALDPGFVYTYMATSPDKLEQATAGLMGHLQRVCEESVSDEEMERAKRYLVGTRHIDLQRGGARAMLMALGERVGLGYDHFTHYSREIESVTSEDIRRVAQHYLAPEKLVQVVVGP